MDYKVATGYDVPLVDLDSIDPQPRSKGVQITQRSFASSGSVNNQGFFIELEWSAIMTEAEYLALMTQFGLHAAYSAAVTIYVPNSLYVEQRLNGRALRPEIGKDADRNNQFIRNVTIIVRDLEAST